MKGNYSNPHYLSTDSDVEYWTRNGLASSTLEDWVTSVGNRPLIEALKNAIMNNNRYIHLYHHKKVTSCWINPWYKEKYLYNARL